jgi:organic radical activating enzyme
MTCQAPIQQGERKGTLCGRETTEKYCGKHKRQEIIDNAQAENIRYCDVARGCFTRLEDYEAKCKRCLHKARINDRKANDKKRQDTTICLDCARKLTDEIQAKGKHDKPLRRCIPCYEKLQKQESNRSERKRTYKAEAFTNKHVIWNQYVKGAKKRGINFSLTKTHFESLLIMPCFYCRYEKQSEINGIDRVDNQKGYIENNVVTCCEVCNVLKGSQHPQEFIDKMRAIYNYQTSNQSISSEIVEKWGNTYRSKTSANYKTYAKSANTRNISFEISESDFMAMTQKSCYLCGLSDKNGIDRFDNAKGYIVENCRPCCGHCNLMKKDRSFEEILLHSKEIDSSYDKLSEYVATKDIAIRMSKVEGRTKVDNPEIKECISMEYKPLNEIITPKEPIAGDIQHILEKQPIIPKQWKTKQIYEFIQENKENEYKTYCEEHNTIQQDWEMDWITFVLSVKAKSYEESEPIIRAFVENLRRIRHNQLCAKDTIEREDREQWPAVTVVKAFLEGKIDKFKQYTEEHVGEKQDDPKWIKRWNSFVTSLANNRENEKSLKDLCSKFMAAQRIKKYRNKSAL